MLMMRWISLSNVGRSYEITITKIDMVKIFSVL